MHRRTFLKGSMMMLGGATLKANEAPSPTARPLPWVAAPEYYDDTLPRDPKEIHVVPFKGERYEVLAPDTLELAENAENTVHGLTHLISPVETDYAIYHLLHKEANPIVFEIGHGSNQNLNPKWAEALVLMRSMCGSTKYLEGDQTLMCSVTRLTGKDGLFYVPVKDRPWAFIDPVTEKRGTPYADIFGEARQLRAYVIWYQHDGNPLWKRLANRKVDRLLQLVIKKGDTHWFKLARGYSPWYKESGEGPVAALGDVGQVFTAMTGSAAANMVCWMPHAAGSWYKVSGYEPALELARGLARYLYEDPEFYDRKTGKFRGGGFAPHCFASLLSYAFITNDKEIINWVKLGADQFFELHDPNRTGIAAPMMHPCDWADMMQVASMLSRNGIEDYWETIDLWVRSAIPTIQYNLDDKKVWDARPVALAGDPNNKVVIRNLAYITEGLRPYVINGGIPLNRPLAPELQQPRDANERAVGACWGAGCCNGNVPRGVYLVWDSIMEGKGDQLKVNLLMNRASVWADLDSYIPYEGKALLRMKQAKRNVLVRIPTWTEKSEVTCTVNGKPAQYRWTQNGYADIGKVEAGDSVTIQFPMKERIVETPLKIGAGHVLGTLTLDYIGLANSQDDFSGRSAGKLDRPGIGNNDGKNGLPWRFNQGVGNVPSFDGNSAIQIPIVGNWNTFIDTVGTPQPEILTGKNTVFVAVFKKTPGGDVAMGLVRDASWDTGGSPTGQQRLFKIKANKVYIGRFYRSDQTDEDTGVRIVPDKYQALMMRFDPKGSVSYFYQDGSDKNMSSPAWKDITPASSPAGNTADFTMDYSYVGVNGVGEGTAQSRVKLRGNSIVEVSPNVAGYPIERQRFKGGPVRMKKATRFVTEQRFVWD